MKDKDIGTGAKDSEYSDKGQRGVGWMDGGGRDGARRREGERDRAHGGTEDRRAESEQGNRDA